MLTLLIILWWITIILSTVVVTSLVAALGWSAFARVRAGASGAAPPVARRGLNESGPLRRTVLLCWSTATLIWVSLEILGVVLLLSSRRSKQEPLPAALPPPPPGEMRLVAIGGSTILGAPYQKWLSIPEIVGAQLAGHYPGATVRVQNLASGGAGIEDMQDALGRLDASPDVMLVYTGHNEFLRFPPDREAGVAYYGGAYPSLLARVIATEIERLSAHEGPQWRGQRRLFDRPVCTVGETQAVHRRFQDALDRILRFARAQHALTIVFLPASNEADFAPNRSVVSSDHSAAAIARLKRIYQDLGRPNVSPGMRHRLLKDARGLAPEFAETWYRFGMLYDRAGLRRKARKCYGRARDLDRFPVRATSTIVDTVRRLAARHGAVTVDARQVLRRLDGRQLPDGAVFHDNVHPNLPAHVALANAVLEIMGRQRAPLGRGLPAGWRVPSVHVRDVARRFGLDRQAWITFSEDEGEFCRYLAVYRYDIEGRLGRAQAYYDAAERIRRGIAPRDANIPGMAVRAHWE